MLRRLLDYLTSILPLKLHLSLCFHTMPPAIYIVGVYLLMVTLNEWGCGGRVIFCRIITHSSVSPLILPTDPNSSISTPIPSSFPPLLSALLNQGAVTIAPEWQFFTLILRLVVMEIGLSKRHHSVALTWNMNDEFEFCAHHHVCVCVRANEGANRRISVVNHSSCHFITGGERLWSKRKKKKCSE